MNRTRLLTGIFIVLVVAFMWDRWRGGHSEHPEPTLTDAEQPLTTVEESKPEVPAADSAESIENVTPAASDDPAVVQSRFTAQMRELARCLSLSENLGNDPVQPNLKELAFALKGDVGEPILQTEDWSSVLLTTPTGEKRRIRVEVDYSSEDRVVRRIKYEKIDHPETPELIPLTTEQSEDPSETFLASLESDGAVQSRESSQRVYFSGGEEIVAVESNGQLKELDVNRNGKNFHCRPSAGWAEPCTCQ